MQFHWDREGKNDERSSCWIRTMQPWAGAAWGHQFIPRIGMEVVVTFEGGDPDKPMVLGSLYNGTHPPAFKLPDFKTKSGIRTNSTPGGHGHNEISFEDRAGHEIFHIHAQRDYEEIVRHNQTSRVDGGRSVEVRGSASEHIGRDAKLDVIGDRSTFVHGHDKLRVEGRISGEVEGDHTMEVRGHSTTTVLKGHSVEVRGHRALVVGTPEEAASSDHYVHGTASLGAADRIVLNAEKGMVLRCGESTIELSPDKIVLRSPTVDISPTKALECSTKDGPSMTLGPDVEILAKKLRVFTESGALELDKDFKVKGASIKLGYDPSKPSKDQKDQDPEKKPFSCKLTNYFFQPYAGKTYHLMVEGLRIEGQTDGEGTVKEQIPKTAKQVVVRLWIDDFPEGRQRVYRFKVTDLPPADDVVGAKHRLKNLGYYHGLMDEKASDELRSALAEFQHDHHDTHGLDPTGELDGGTAGALKEVHGS